MKKYTLCHLEEQCGKYSEKHFSYSLCIQDGETFTDAVRLSLSELIEPSYILVASPKFPKEYLL